MGKQTPSAQEVATKVVSGTFTGTGQSGNAISGLQSGVGVSPHFKDVFNAMLRGVFVATVVLEKSFDGGVNYDPVSKDASGNAASYTAPCNLGVYEPEHNILYRWNCTSWTSGTVEYRISQ